MWGVGDSPSNFFHLEGNKENHVVVFYKNNNAPILILKLSVAFVCKSVVEEKGTGK